MEVGFVIPHIGRDVSTSVIDTTCAMTEELGAYALWFGDHIVFPYDYQSVYPYGTRTGFTASDPEPFWEAFTVMAYVAARTQRVKLCTGVAILPYRHPLLTAKIVATIDRLSGGRVMFGAGVGWLEEEFGALGLDTFAHRGSVSDEQLEVIIRAWSEERPAFAGSYYQFPSVSLTPKPVQRPHPPILIGGNGRAAFRRVIRFGDYWHAAMLFPDELVEGRATLATMAQQSGRTTPPGTSLLISIYLTKDAGYRETMSEAQRRQAIAGTPDQVITQLQAYRDAGVDQLQTALGGDGAFGRGEDLLRYFLQSVWPALPAG
jgi:probable F420-dependent oxidoreductase